MNRKDIHNSNSKSRADDNKPINPFPSFYSPDNDISQTSTPEIDLDENNVTKFFDLTLQDTLKKKEIENDPEAKHSFVVENTNISTPSQSSVTTEDVKKDVDIFPDLQLESYCRSTSLSSVSSVMSASKAARKLKNQRTLSKDRSEDTKH